jgi:hypothetical protein
MTESFSRLMRLALAAAFVTLAAGCVSNYYVVPTPVVKQYDEKLPIQVGFLISNELRGKWYSQREFTKGRLDIPIGEIVEKHAQAFLSEAFEEFYMIRYPHRRSKTGILLKLNSIKFIILDDQAYATLNITIEGEDGKEIRTSDYFGVGVTGEDMPMRFRVSKVEKELAESTRLALYWAFREVLLDVKTLLDQKRI